MLVAPVRNSNWMSLARPNFDQGAPAFQRVEDGNQSSISPQFDLPAIKPAATDKSVTWETTA
jgi:hypothetical protein